MIVLIFKMTVCQHNKCVNRASDQLFSCSGICGKGVHAKCVGLTQPVADRVRASDSGVHWYCSECRKISLNQLTAKINIINDQFSKLVKNFVETSNNIISLQTHFARINEFPSINLNELATSINLDETKVVVNELANISLNDTIVDQHEKDLSVPLSENLPTSDILTRDHNVTKRRGKVPLKDNSPTTTHNTNECLDVSSNVVIEPKLPIPAAIVVPAIIGSNGACPLRAVPQTKVLFVSRLACDLTQAEVQSYVKSCLGATNLTNNFESIRCVKISRPGSFVSSFKIMLPLHEFNYLLSPALWPANIVLQEFIPRQAIPLPPTLSAITLSSPSNSDPPNFSSASKN